MALAVSSSSSSAISASNLQHFAASFEVKGIVQEFVFLFTLGSEVEDIC